MLTSNEAIAEVNFLAQSPVRVQILELLCEKGALTKSELNERFDVSRVTIQRNLEALEGRDWIDNSHPTYAITPLGELVIEEVAPLTDSMAIMRKLQPFLKWMPRNSFDLDPRELADATIIAVDEKNPTDWVHHHTDRIRSSTNSWGLLPGTGIEAWNAAVDSSADGGFSAELIVDPKVAETLRSDPLYVDKVETLLERDALDLYTYDGSIPYHIGRFDQYIQIVVADDEGIPRALVETNSDTVREWGESEFESYREQAEPLEF